MAPLTFKSVDQLDRDAAVASIASNDPERVVDALLALAFHDDDRKFVEQTCAAQAKSPDVNVRGVAVLCFGHLARIHGALSLDVALPIVRKALLDLDPWVRGQADTARSDIEHFLGPGAWVD